MRKLLNSIIFIGLITVGFGFINANSTELAANQDLESYPESRWGHQPAKITKEVVYRENPHLLEYDQKKEEEESEPKEIREHEED
jgi:hypothetical protein